MINGKVTANNIRMLRKINNLSQTELAIKIHVTKQAISKWEGGSIPDVDNLLTLAELFSVTIDFMLHNVEPIRLINGKNNYTINNTDECTAINTETANNVILADDKSDTNSNDSTYLQSNIIKRIARMRRLMRITCCGLTICGMLGLSDFMVDSFVMSLVWIIFNLMFIFILVYLEVNIPRKGMISIFAINRFISGTIIALGGILIYAVIPGLTECMNIIDVVFLMFSVGLVLGDRLKVYKEEFNA